MKSKMKSVHGSASLKSQQIETTKGQPNDGKTLKGLDTREHDVIISRTTGWPREISMGMHGTSTKVGDFGGLVPSNPFASLAQAGYMHTHPEILGKKGLKEWDNASRGRKVPKHVKKG